jgi:hypothetical protein
MIDAALAQILQTAVHPPAPEFRLFTRSIFILGMTRRAQREGHAQLSCVLSNFPGACIRLPPAGVPWRG